LCLDVARCFNEIDAVVIVFINTRRNGKDVRVKNNIFGREVNLLGEYLVGTGANLGSDLGRRCQNQAVDGADGLQL
jgi:hypothetical protein